MMLELQEIGCHNMNWVTPEHVVPQILEALPTAVERGPRLRVVYNTSAYDSSDSLALMDGVVDIYVPDVKLASSELARRYVGKREYFEVASPNILEMRRQVGDLVLDQRGLARRGLIVRHLEMPGALAETEAVLRFIAKQLGRDTYVKLMGQYRPAGHADRYVEINRRPYRDELASAFAIADRLGLRRLDQRSRNQARAAAGTNPERDAFLQAAHGDRSRDQATDIATVLRKRRVWRDRVNVNRVVLTGNLTADPELRPTLSGTPVARLRSGGQHPPAEQLDRRMGGEAQLLRRDGVGSAGRELRALPMEGTAGRGRWPAGVAGVRSEGWDHTPSG
jgi:pyruvate-formate lyase-activating enzyme